MLHIKARTRQALPQEEEVRQVEAVATLDRCLSTMSFICLKLRYHHAEVCVSATEKGPSAASAEHPFA